MKKANFNQCLECEVPKRWSKYTTIKRKKGNFTNTHNKLN